MFFKENAHAFCLGNVINGLDFNPLGTLTVSIDDDGVCLISNIDTSECSFHLQLGSKSGNLSIHLCFLKS